MSRFTGDLGREEEDGLGWEGLVPSRREHREVSNQPRWITCPNEQAWWWHWNGEDYAIPHIYSIMVSKTGRDRYFIAHPDSRWCDEIGGFWLKVGYPNVPGRAEQAILARNKNKT